MAASAPSRIPSTMGHKVNAEAGTCWYFIMPDEFCHYSLNPAVEEVS